MSSARKGGNFIFQRMDRALVRLGAEANPEAVHSFRTTSRRLETFLLRLLPACDRKQKKLLKLLGRIRRRAGRIRDLDVQLAALRGFKVPQEPRRKTHLIQELIGLRARHEEKLGKLLKTRHLLEIRKKIKQASRMVKSAPIRDPLSVAKEILSSVSISGPVNEEGLHRYRIAVKHSRYAAEFAVQSAEAKRFIEELKLLQDALGNWHDWTILTQTAAEHLGEVSQSSLVAALHNVSRVKFRHALAAVSTSRASSEVRAPANAKPAGKLQLMRVNAA
jgi:CHAD domain-containing protein